MAILGVFLIVAGVAFVLLGFAGAVLEMFKKARSTDRGVPSLSDISKLIDALTGLLKALTAAPMWLACVFIGSVFIAAGGYLLAK
jgi:hypothetical protein